MCHRGAAVVSFSLSLSVCTFICLLGGKVALSGGRNQPCTGETTIECKYMPKEKNKQFSQDGGAFYLTIDVLI